MNRKDRRAAQKQGAPDPDFATAVQAHQAGRLPEAEQAYRKVIERNRTHAPALHYLGIVAMQTGRPDLAIEMFERSVAQDSHNPESQYNLAFALQTRGRLDKSAQHYRRAIKLKPDHAGAYLNLGNVLADTGAFAEAASAYEHAIAVKPDAPEAYFNLGNTLARQRKHADAIPHFEQAIRLKPDLAEAHNGLGAALTPLGKHEAALAALQRALSLNPKLPQAHMNVGILMQRMGRMAEGLAFFRQAIDLNPKAGEDDNLKILMGRAIKGLASVSDPRPWSGLVLQAMKEAWARPKDLTPATDALIKHSEPFRRWKNSSGESTIADLNACGQDEFLLEALISAPTGDGDCERYLTAARSTLTRLWESLAADDVLKFACALARQCFINDYVFSQPSSDLETAAKIQAALEDVRQQGKPIPSLWLAILGSYAPLHRLPDAERLMQETWPPCVSALLQQQIAAPLQERAFAQTMPRLTQIDDEVSHRVRQQYEESPYPHWVRPSLAGTPAGIDDYIRSLFPLAPFRPLKLKNFDMLIAGCGTGQHPADMARKITGASILAIDLSLASLSYAKRKALEFDIKELEFAQADILRMAQVDRTFEVLESAGVLHHLGDPWAGWRALLTRLKPGGLMFTALYSDTGRADIVAVRDMIAAQNIPATPDGIRRFRQTLMDFPRGTPQRNVTTSPDFFTTSECRDLLFHTQEHRMTLPQIGAFLTDNKLTFLGFELTPDVKARYAAKNPDDAAMTDLGGWHDFEKDNPLTFAGMYQFWVQKN